MTYQPFGAVTALAYGNGLALAKTYTQDYLIGTLNVADGVTTILDRAYAFGDDINLTGITDNLLPARSETHAYTPANRLEQSDGIWGTLDWTYDAVGNRASETLSSAPGADTYNYPGTNNRLASITQSGVTTRAFTYDGAGNVTADDRGGTVYNYGYNNRGRLSQLTIGATVTANYIYDGLERMALRTTQNMTPAGTTHYLYDLSGRLIVEADDAGATLREYIWLDDMPLAVVADVNTANPNLYFVHPDHLNRPLKMTDGTKAVVWDAVYRPFGEAVSITGTAANNLRFPGQYFLMEGGLAYNWYRHYDATTGRYLQPDPLGFRIGPNLFGPNLYAYANGNPITKVDPSGQFWIGGAIGGALFNSGVQVGTGLFEGQSVGEAIKCINWTNVAVSAVAGFIGPTFLGNVASSAWHWAAGSGSLNALAANSIIYGTVMLPNKAFVETWLPPWRLGSECECGPASHAY